MIQPFEVSYIIEGRQGRRRRNVIGVLCPTALSQCLHDARPIFVSLGDVVVNWDAPVSPGYRMMFAAPKPEE
jgi:hypothetical protein